MSWPLVKLHEICRPRQWKTISASNLLEAGYPVYGANGKIGFYSEYTHEFPTLMITCRGATCGNVHISEPKSYINGNAMALDDLNCEQVDIRYLYYYLLGRGFDDVISGSAQPQITGQGLTKIEIPLPPLPEQKRIAAILDKADAIRRKRQQAIQLADDFLRAVFLDMFGDPVTNPKGWPVKPFGSLVINKDGKRIPIKASDRSDMEGQYPYYGASGVIDYVNDFIFEGAHLLIGEDGANLLARSTPIAFIADGQYWVNNHAHVLGEKDGVPLEYLAFSINLRNLEPFVSGSAQPKLNQENLNKIPVQVPPAAVMEKFLTTLKKHRAYMGRVSESEPESLFSSLSQKAFSGQL